MQNPNLMSANVLNPIVDMYQTQLEASRQFADALFSGTEKIDRVMIDATHRAFSEQLRFAQALAAARDPRGLATLQSSFMGHQESTMNYQKEIMRVFSELQNEIGKSLQQYVEQLSSRGATGATRSLETAQEQARDRGFNPMTGMFSVWESAFKEVTALANKNMEAARSSFKNAATAAVNASAVAGNGAASAASMTDSEGDDRKAAAGHRRK